jgi:hypothetical protein
MNGNPRATARVVLATVTALLMLFVLFASGPVGGLNLVFAQTASPSGPCQGAQIEWVNPSSHSREISAEQKAGDQAGSDNYHLVAWVTNVPPNAVVEFKYVPSGGSETRITPENTGATRVGADTFEHFWTSAAMPADGTYTLRAQLFVSGQATPCDQDDETAAVVNDDAEQGPPPASAGESIEITDPANGAGWGLYRAPDATAWTGVIRTKASGGDSADPTSSETTYHRAYYSVSAPGTEPVWKECTGSPSTSDDAADGIRCTLKDNDTPEEVNLVGAVANDYPFPGPITAENQAQFNSFNDSGDGHRVEPYRQDIDEVTLRFEDENGSAVGTPAGNQASNQTVGGCSPYLVATALDQNNKPVAGANMDSHAQGPSDGLKYASDANTSAFEAPNQAHNREEPAWDCEGGTTGSGGEGGTQGDHEGPGETDIKHIESTDNTDDNGRFLFRMHSPVAGNTQVVVFADEDIDDQYCSSEPSAAASIAWGTAGAPAPIGLPAEESNCPVPGQQTTTSPATTTTTTTSTTSAPGTTTTTATTGPSVHRADTSVTRPRYRRGAFRGRVSSTSDDCVGRRLVLIKKVRRGPDRTVARDRTNNAGNFAARERRARGRFYAIVAAKTIETPTTITHCQRARSRTTRVRRR